LVSENLIPKSEFETRIKKTQKKAEEKGLDALLIFSSFIEREGNVGYLTNYHSAFPPCASDDKRKGIGFSCFLLPVNDEGILIVDSVTADMPLYGIREVKKGLDVLSNIVKAFKELRLEEKHVGIVGADVLPVKFYNFLKEKFSKTVFESVDYIVENQRMIKSESEIKVMKKAAEVADEGLKRFFEITKEDMSEYEVALEVEKACFEAGAEYLARIRVHSGEWSATTARWPFSTQKKIRKGEVVLLDLVGWYNHYAFDVGRVLVVGKPDKKQKEVFETAVQAEEAEINAVKPGLKAEELSAVAEKFLAKTDFKDYASPLGHGIGLEVVENPWIMRGNKTVLKPNMVLCIEPGIMVPGFMGVRIEDIVVVTKTGFRYLTETPKIPW